MKEAVKELEWQMQEGGMTEKCMSHKTEIQKQKDNSGGGRNKDSLTMQEKVAYYFNLY